MYIRTKWIEPAGDYIQEVQEMEKARKEAAKREHEEEQTPGETDSLDETKDPDETDRPDEAQTSEEPPDTAQTPEPEVNTVAGGLEHPLFKDEGGQPDDNGGADSQGGSAAGFPDLNSLSHFQPDAGVRMTVSLDTKPEETFYYPEAYGGIYEDSHWSGAAFDDAVSEEHMQYRIRFPGLRSSATGMYPIPLMKLRILSGRSWRKTRSMIMSRELPLRGRILQSIFYLRTRRDFAYILLQQLL